MVFLPPENRATSHVSKQMTYHESRLYLIGIRLRLTIESQLFDCVQLHSIDSAFD